MTCADGKRTHSGPKERSEKPKTPGPTKIVSISALGTRVHGSLPPETVKRALRANFPSLRMCFEDSLLRSEGTTHGYVKIELEIGAHGGAQWATTRSTRIDSEHDVVVEDPTMLRCIEAVVACIPFPAPEQGTVRVTYPLTFATHDTVEYVFGDLRWFGHVTFVPDTDTIEPRSFADLDALAHVLNGVAKDLELIEIGDFVHLDVEEAHAVELSEARARAVVAALVQRGVAASRLLARGYGRYCPNLPNASEHARPSNERIAVVVVKSGGKPTGALRGCKAARDKGIAPAPLP
jgi:outer membrane protein OmpA-like peptidoglycan-associated protein